MMLVVTELGGPVVDRMDGSDWGEGRGGKGVCSAVVQWVSHCSQQRSG